MLKCHTINSTSKTVLGEGEIVVPEQNALYKKGGNRYLRGKSMTLIIGFRCSQGASLVSDTKKIDLETGDSDFTHKILTPLKNAPFVVGAAGFSDLFRQFNREVPLMVSRRLNEYSFHRILT